jgi:hypothetical protein
MIPRTLIALAIAGGFAVTAQAGGNKLDKNASAAASSGATASSPSFQSLDRNHDGFLSSAELKGSALEKNWQKLDKNRDGKLSQAEYNAASGNAASGGTKQKSKY